MKTAPTQMKKEVDELGRKTPTPINDHFDHLMVDIETMGVNSYAAIVSIAAIEFNTDGSTGREFYEKISLEDCIKVGLKIELKTVKWWMSRKDVGVDQFTGSTPLSYALFHLRMFMTQQKYIWANSPRFDLGLIKNACEKVYPDRDPWDHKKEMCYRTLVSLSPDILAKHEWKGTKHNPLDDCRNQIEIACKIMNKLNVMQG